MAKELKTTARVYPIENPVSDLLAFANVTVGDCFVINNLRVIQGETEPFVVMPSTKSKEGQWYDTVFPVTAEMRQAMVDAVLSEYARVSALPENERGYDRPAEVDPSTALSVANVRLHLTLDHGKQLATGSVTIGGCLVVQDLKVIDDPKGAFMVMPSHRDSVGEFRDVAYPVTSQMRQNLNIKVMDKYIEVCKYAERKADRGEKAADRPAEKSNTEKKGADRSVKGTIEAAKQESKKRNAQRDADPPAQDAPRREPEH